MVLCLSTLKALTVDVQFASFALQEALAQACRPAPYGEIDLDRRRGCAIAPRTKVLDTARAMALEKCRTNRHRNGAFAYLIWADKQVDTVGKAPNLC